MSKKIFIRSAVFIFSFLPGILWAEAPVADAVPVSGLHPTASASSEPVSSSVSNSTSVTASDSGNYFNSSSNGNSGDPAELPLSQDNSNSSSYASSISSSSTSLLSRVNEQQKEIQRLRGQLEVQSHELSQLKEQQQAYYNDLDQRINMLSSGKKTPVMSLDNTMPASTVPPKTTNTSSTSTTTPHGTGVPAIAMIEKTDGTSAQGAQNEESEYNAAYALIEQKKFTEANTAMHAFIKKYPKGQYAANAHYWLGELLLAQHQDKAAIDEFNTVIHDYPASTKVSAAMLKLGFAYANLGDTEKAKTTFVSIEQMYPGTTTAQLARSRLDSLN